MKTKRKRKKAGPFPVPDDLLRQSYLAVAQQADCWREDFISQTALVEAVKTAIGPMYAHVSVDALRARIITCCKSPALHGGGWAGTKTGHGPTKNVKRMSPEYKAAVASPEFGRYAALLRELFGYRCAMCFSQGRLEAHHRHYNTLGKESGYDCIPLCKECHKVADRRRQSEAARSADEQEPKTLFGPDAEAG